MESTDSTTGTPAPQRAEGATDLTSAPKDALTFAGQESGAGVQSRRREEEERIAALRRETNSAPALSREEAAKISPFDPRITGSAPVDHGATPTGRSVGTAGTTGTAAGAAAARGTTGTTGR